MYPVTLRLILFKNVLPKGSMEISVYPVILRLIQKFFTKRVDGNFHVLYPLTLRLIQKCFYLKGPVILRLTNSLRKGSMKFVTERVHGNFHVSCDIKFNLKKLLPKRSMEIS